MMVFRKPESRFLKSGGLVKKREEWIKNWVSRKYNKPKFPRVVVPPFTPITQVQKKFYKTKFLSHLY